MTPTDSATFKASSDPAVHVAMLALRKALASPEGNVTAATETQVQNTLHLLRSTAPHSEAVELLETAAKNLRLLSGVKREGRCNLYMSQLIRMRKRFCA